MRWTSALGLAVLIHAAIGLWLATAEPARSRPRPLALVTPAPVEIDALGRAASGAAQASPSLPAEPGVRAQARRSAPRQATARRSVAPAIPSAPPAIPSAAPAIPSAPAGAPIRAASTTPTPTSASQVMPASPAATVGPSVGREGGGSASGVGAKGGAGGSGGRGSGGVGAGGADRQALIATALARIRAHRHYPELARRRGIEGTVGIAFRVAPDGEVSDLAVRRSADPALDQAALEAVRKAAPLPPLGAVEVELDFHLDER